MHDKADQLVLSEFRICTTTLNSTATGQLIAQFSMGKFDWLQVLSDLVFDPLFMDVLDDIHTTTILTRYLLVLFSQTWLACNF